jgi:hypothetical protein
MDRKKVHKGESLMIIILSVLAAWINLSITIYCVYKLWRYKSNIREIVSALIRLTVLNDKLEDTEGDVNKEYINTNLVGFIQQIKHEFKI